MVPEWFLTNGEHGKKTLGFSIIKNYVSNCDHDIGPTVSDDVVEIKRRVKYQEEKQVHSYNPFLKFGSRAFPVS